MEVAVQGNGLSKFAKDAEIPTHPYAHVRSVAIGEHTMQEVTHTRGRRDREGGVADVARRVEPNDFCAQHPSSMRVQTSKSRSASVVMRKPHSHL